MKGIHLLPVLLNFTVDSGEVEMFAFPVFHGFNGFKIWVGEDREGKLIAAVKFALLDNNLLKSMSGKMR
jgi:hypothetical protein